MLMIYIYQYLVEQLLHLLIACLPQTAHWCSEDGITGNVTDDEHSLSFDKGILLFLTNKEMYSCFSQKPLAWSSSPACFTAALSSFTDINRNGAACCSMTVDADEEEKEEDDDEGNRTEDEGADGDDIANSDVDTRISLVSSSLVSSASGYLGMHTSL